MSEPEPLIMRLISLSVEKGWSMRHLGRLSGVDYSYLARLKRGASDPTVVSLSVSSRLAKALEVEITLETD